MGSLLSYGAGASEGLDKVLQRMLLESKLAEEERQSRASEDIQRKNLEENSRYRQLQQDQLGETRRQAEEGRQRDDARNTVTMMSPNSEVSPETYKGLTEHGIPGDFFLKQAAPDDEAVAAGVPPALAPNDPTDQTIKFKGTAQQLAEEENQKRLERAANQRIETANSNRNTLSATSEGQLINRLNARWVKASEPKRMIDRQLGMMDAGLAAAERGDLAQGAQAVLVTFQKILDPPSVVRESEYMRSAAGLSMMNRIKGFAERLAKGGAGVPLSELKKFAQVAREAAAEQNTGYLGSEKKRLGLNADRYGIPHELIFEDDGDASSPDSSSGGLPQVGGTFNGGKVLKITPIN